MGRKPKNWDGPAQYVLSLSYGKDSLACLGAIEKLGWSLDRILHAEVWATDTIQADLPEMIEFKAKADAIIKERWGIEVEHRCATRNGEKVTYEKLFYHVPKRKPGGKFASNSVAGFPYTTGSWCNDRLKTTVLSKTVNERERESITDAAAQAPSVASPSSGATGVSATSSDPSFLKAPLHKERG